MLIDLKVYNGVPIQVDPTGGFRAVLAGRPVMRKALRELERLIDGQQAPLPALVLNEQRASDPREVAIVRHMKDGKTYRDTNGSNHGDWRELVVRRDPLVLARARDLAERQRILDGEWRELCRQAVRVRPEDLLAARTNAAGQGVAT